MEIKILFLQVRKQTFRVIHSLLLSWQMGVLEFNLDLFEMKVTLFFSYSAFICKYRMQIVGQHKFVSYFLTFYPIYVFFSLPLYSQL